VIKLLQNLYTTSQTKLCNEIEQIRSRMVVLGTQYGFLHPDVQQCSRQLDELLLEFYVLVHQGAKLLSAAALED
jgi:hypothetical protein